MNVCSYRPIKFMSDVKGINERFKTLFDTVCYLRGTGIPGGGTVTTFSAGNLSPLFTSSVSSAATTPSLTFAQVSQSANLVYASPNGSAGVPTFRTLVTDDISLSVDLPLTLVADVISIPQADVNNDGYLSAADYNEFHLKWSPVGNAASSGDFIGTTNAQPFLVKANNLQVVSISGDGNYRYNFSPNALSQTGTYNFIFGYQPTISSNYSLSGGYQTTASGLASVAVNRNTQATGSYSFACGSSSIASGQGSFATNNAQMGTFGGAGFGLNNEIATDASLPTSIDADNRIFIIGNGSGTSNRHNALTVLHGSDVVNGTKPLFGFNTLLPTSTVSVGGSFEATYVAKTADYTANELDYTIHFTANTSTFTLPTAVGCTGRIYVVKNTSGNNLTLATTSSQTIDGAAPGTLATGNAAQLQSTGANWIKIN